MDSREARRTEMQKAIDTAEELDDDEYAEKEELSTDGFGTWSKRHFQQFINGSARHGRNEYEKITVEVEGKTLEDVKEYAAAFWSKYKAIGGEYSPYVYSSSDSSLTPVDIPPDWEKNIHKIEEGEAKIEERANQARCLAAKVKSYDYPMQELHLSYGQNKGKQYTEEEDRFLIVRLDHWGLQREDVYELIKKDVGDWPLFR